MLLTVDAAVMTDLTETEIWDAAVDLVTTVVCGSSFFLFAVADLAEVTDVTTDEATTVVSGSSCYSFSAVDAETTDVDSNIK